MERSADEVGESFGHHTRITTAHFKVGEDLESSRCVRIERGTRKSNDIFGAWEAEELFNIGRAQRVNP